MKIQDFHLAATKSFSQGLKLCLHEAAISSLKRSAEGHMFNPKADKQKLALVSASAAAGRVATD